jgi:hypothetical protein
MPMTYWVNLNRSRISWYSWTVHKSIDTCRMILGSDGKAKPFLSPSSFDNLSQLLLIALTTSMFNYIYLYLFLFTLLYNSLVRKFKDFSIHKFTDIQSEICCFWLYTKICSKRQVVLLIVYIYCTSLYDDFEIFVESKNGKSSNCS